MKKHIEKSAVFGLIVVLLLTMCACSRKVYQEEESAKNGSMESCEENYVAEEDTPVGYPDVIAAEDKAALASWINANTDYDSQLVRAGDMVYLQNLGGIVGYDLNTKTAKQVYQYNERFSNRNMAVLNGNLYFCNVSNVLYRYDGKTDTLTELKLDIPYKFYYVFPADGQILLFGYNNDEFEALKMMVDAVIPWYCCVVDGESGNYKQPFETDVLELGMRMASATMHAFSAFPNNGKTYFSSIEFSGAEQPIAVLRKDGSFDTVGSADRRIQIFAANEENILICDFAFSQGPAEGISHPQCFNIGSKKITDMTAPSEFALPGIRVLGMIGDEIYYTNMEIEGGSYSQYDEIRIAYVSETEHGPIGIYNIKTGEQTVMS